MLLRKNCDKSFTLIELIVVISIIGILATIALPAYDEHVKKAKEVICNVNCMQVERMYEMYLKKGNLERTRLGF